MHTVYCIEVFFKAFYLTRNIFSKITSIECAAERNTTVTQLIRISNQQKLAPPSIAPQKKSLLSAV